MNSYLLLKILFLAIVLFLIVIFLRKYIYNQSNIEEFTTNKNINNTSYQKHVVLLGDSVFKNNAFVNPSYAIEELLRKKTNDKVHCLAKDGALIKDVYNQIDYIPYECNNKESIIFLSIGGNNLLKNNIRLHKSDTANDIFKTYKELVKKLKTSFSKCKLVLLNLYIPPNINKIKKNDYFVENIKIWNNKVYNYVTSNNNTFNLLKIDTLLYKPDDFVSNYEPSIKGGYKIVNAVLRFINKNTK